jgi:hypothetical protein
MNPEKMADTGAVPGCARPAASVHRRQSRLGAIPDQQAQKSGFQQHRIE